MAKVVTFPTTQKSDAAARSAALDPHHSFIIEAPAGSGKTGLLVQRFLTLLADPAVESPEEVLAITFTRKATAEMQERVLHEFQTAHTKAPLPQDDDFARHTRSLAEAALERSNQRGWDLLAQPGRLNIRSILSVCVDLAHSLPLLSGGGTLQPLDNAAPLYQLAARQTLLQLGGNNPNLNDALHTVLLHRDGNVANCERLIAEMLHTREQWGELIPLDRALDDEFLDNVIRPRLEQTLNHIVCSGLTRAFHAMPPGLLKELTTFAANHAHLPGYNGKESPIALCANKHEPPHTTAEHLDHWRLLIRLLLKPSDGGWRAGFARNHIGFEIPKPAATYLKELVQTIQSDSLQAALAAVFTLPPATYPEEQWIVTKALFHVLRHALIELKLVFASRGVCDFSELSLAAHAALTDPEGTPGLTLPGGGSLRHLLVDEMQDTSTGQYALIEALTRSWDGHSQTLFLVGDPKQSIYLFRAARVERFLRTLREARLGDITLIPLRLTANFRSQAKLVDGFNDTFGGTDETKPIFPPPSTTNANEVPFVHADATRKQTQPEGIVWHTDILEEDALDYDEHEAREIRHIIEQRLDTELPEGRSKPWRIAVLARSRSHLEAVVREFKSRDGKPEIPFRGIDLDPLDERPEVLDALALTRALLHPADRTAWLAVLHAPWCGLGLADLLTLAGEDKTATMASLIASRRKLLSAAVQPLLDRAWPVLASALTTLGRTPLSVHVERTWLSLGGDAPLMPEQRTNVLRYLAVLSEIEAESTRIDLNELTTRLNKLFAEPRTGDDIHVDLTTIHKAKGLEWDLVLVPGLQRRTRRSGSVLLNWLELDGIGPNEDAAILLAPIWGKGADSDQLNDWLRSIRNQRDRAEEKRLFYVAATRAREQLHLFAALGRTSKGELASPISGTLLNACWPAAEPQFTALDNDQTMSSPLESAQFADEAKRPLNWPSHGADFELDLAASATETAAEVEVETAPLLQRLPLTFDPTARFNVAPTIVYPDASQLRQSPTFDRPEGSFAVRAFGNVVHRYMQLLAVRLEATAFTTLLAELPNWLPRLTASLRGEGLPPALAESESKRVLTALTNTLTDPIGLWLLSPHAGAANEYSLTTNTQTLRVDRTFLAGDTPRTTKQTHIWIVDFKTTDPGGRSDFDTVERAKYSAQLEAYAVLRRAQPSGALPIQLALYYPLVPRLIHWPSES
jgi:ATP-dependent exoDNAse (exonuclease V) beta subunit